jgi:hypothetical protein
VKARLLKTTVFSMFCAAASAFNAHLFCQSPSTIFYYGAVSNSSDAGIISMTEDLFFTQLAQLEKYSVVDRREIRYSEDALKQGGAASVFYAEIMEVDGVWECTLHALNPSQNKHALFTKKYDTYYKILTEAKTSLASVLRDLEEPAASGGAAAAVPVQVSLNALAGNWSGDSSINKVVLLRGGKGFVIFKNGASMNIDVSIEKNAVTITQTSKPNASFYPDLPREVALVAAQTAPPIEWVFTMQDSNTLTGVQKTVRFTDSATTSVEIPAVWKRAN